MTAMTEAVQVAPSAGVTSLLNPVPAQRARLLLAQGDTATPARWAEQRGLRPDDEPGYAQEPEYLVLARILLAQDRPDQAISLLQQLLASATAQGRTGTLAARHDEAAALDALADALMLASAQGHLRVFTDEGPRMGELLGRLVAVGRADQAAGRPEVPLAYLGRLARAFRQASAPDAAPGGTPARPGRAAGMALIEPLSDREAEVLRLMAAGRPNQEIAEELVVALSTVKKHVTHILGKLGAANRTEATARARELGLLP
jgi:LuxR family maltose regulon positive regulatory protein